MSLNNSLIVGMESKQHDLLKGVQIHIQNSAHVRDCNELKTPSLIKHAEETLEH